MCQFSSELFIVHINISLAKYVCYGRFLELPIDTDDKIRRIAKDKLVDCHPITRWENTFLPFNDRAIYAHYDCVQ